jgi:hypothetical protein
MSVLVITIEAQMRLPHFRCMLDLQIFMQLRQGESLGHYMHGQFGRVV